MKVDPSSGYDSAVLIHRPLDHHLKSIVSVTGMFQLVNNHSDPREIYSVDRPGAQCQGLNVYMRTFITFKKEKIS